MRSSGSGLEDVTRLLAGSPDLDRHEGVFLEVGPETGALLGAFLHRTRRGQGQGGLRRWTYASLEQFLDDGLRLSRAMGRKCALAGLWWGGAKGLIAQPCDRSGCDPRALARDAGWRRAVYAEYGRFVTSLRGAYVTAEDVGTQPDDLALVHRFTRFATCVPPEVGGSGNPSAMTAEGVVCAMEAALDALGLGGLEGRTVAVQGVGNVSSAMVVCLLERGVARIVAAEVDPDRRAAALDLDAGGRLDVRLVAPGDASILAEPCDVLAPNALGGVLDAKTVEGVRARVVCGCANNPLADDERDARRLAQRGIVYVPDFVANRMGIVACSNEQYGVLPEDPAVRRHLDPVVEDSIPSLVRRILAEACAAGETTVSVANRLADARLDEPHPLWGHRTRAIIDSLVKDRWEEG